MLSPTSTTRSYRAASATLSKSVDCALNPTRSRRASSTGARDVSASATTPASHESAPAVVFVSPGSLARARTRRWGCPGGRQPGDAPWIPCRSGVRGRRRRRRDGRGPIDRRKRTRRTSRRGSRVATGRSGGRRRVTSPRARAVRGRCRRWTGGRGCSGGRGGRRRYPDARSAGRCEDRHSRERRERRRDRETEPAVRAPTDRSRGPTLGIQKRRALVRRHGARPRGASAVCRQGAEDRQPVSV